MPRRTHAREQFDGLFAAGDLDRYLDRACSAAERSPDWRAGAEYVFEIEDEPYAVAGLERSALIVCHVGAGYDVYFYDGLTGETYQ